MNTPVNILLSIITICVRIITPRLSNCLGSGTISPDYMCVTLLISYYIVLSPITCVVFVSRIITVILSVMILVDNCLTFLHLLFKDGIIFAIFNFSGNMSVVRH